MTVWLPTVIVVDRAAPEFDGVKIVNCPLPKVGKVDSPPTKLPEGVTAVQAQLLVTLIDHT